MPWMGLLIGVGCAGGGVGPPALQPPAEEGTPAAHVREVTVSGDDGAYQFAVTVESSDRSCEQYADWWEIVSEAGELVYRRILAHSHADEQPFTRSGGPVPVSATDRVYVRAHMHPQGYVGAVLAGSVRDGFALVNPESTVLPSSLADTPPQPMGCLY